MLEIRLLYCLLLVYVETPEEEESLWATKTELLTDDDLELGLQTQLYAIFIS